MLSMLSNAWLETRGAARYQPACVIVVLDRDKTLYGQRGVEQAFTSHFAALLGGQLELTDEVRAKLEAEVPLFESLHACMVKCPHPVCH